MALVFIFSILFMIPGMLMAQEETTDTTEEEVIPESLDINIRYPEVQSDLGEVFAFELTVTYEKGSQPFGLEEDASDKIFDLSIDYPENWVAAISPQYKQDTEITAVKLSSGTAEVLTLKAINTIDVDPGEYDITVNIKSTVEGDPLEESATFTAIITSTYEMSFYTKSGLLSMDATTGQDNHFKLSVKNSGSSNLEKVAITVDEPSGWSISLDKENIDLIEPGEEVEIDANIKPGDETIAGDYMVTFHAMSENAEDSIELRTTVETPTVWGIVGIAVIVIVIIAVIIVFARLGRR